MVGAICVTSGSPYPANPTPAPRVVHLNTPHFLSPPQNRLLHGTAASCSSPLHWCTRPPQRICLIDDLVHRTGAGPPSSSYTEPLPRHHLPRSRICFPGANAKCRSTTVVDNELTPIADHDSQRPPRPSFSSSIGNVCIESLSSTCAVPILFIPTLQISWVLLFP